MLKQDHRSPIYFIGALTFLVLEFLFHSSRMNAAGPFLSPLVVFLAPLLFLFFNQAYDKGSGLNFYFKSHDKWHNYLPYIILFIGTIMLGEKIRHAFATYPIEAKMSDIIPIIQACTQRFLSGTTVYTPVVFETYEVNPTYLTFMWLPYVFAEWFQFDYRWIAFGLLILALISWTAFMRKREQHPFEVSFKLLLVFTLLRLILNNRSVDFGLTVEWMPVAIYLFLALAVVSKNSWLIIFSIVVCLLSRYSISFWLPLYLIVCWMDEGFKKAFIKGFFIVLGVLLFYVLPFLSFDWLSYSRGMADYQFVINREWNVNQAQGDVKYPFWFDHGMNFSIYFYAFLDGSNEHKLSIAKWLHTIITIVTAVSLGIFYWWKKKSINKERFLLYSLKIYLLVFYLFFYVPFDYLFYLPLMMSLPVFFWTKYFKASPPNNFASKL